MRLSGMSKSNELLRAMEAAHKNVDANIFLNNRLSAPDPSMPGHTMDNLKLFWQI